MPASLIAAPLLGFFGIEATGFALAATTFAIRLATTYAIASLVAKNAGGNQGAGTPGGQIQLGPNTDNKLPVVYGTSYVSPIVTDAIISSDQKTMWYVLTFSEATDSGTLSFGEVWYDGKLLLFDGNSGGDPNTITAWWTRPMKKASGGGTIETKVAGKISMWFYKDGIAAGTNHLAFDTSGGYGSITDLPQATTLTALEVLTDTRIPAELQWTSATKMSGAVFAILKIDYDQTAGITGLGQIQAKLINSLNQPGDVIKDYLLNTRYGCGVPLTAINTPSLNLINTISIAPLTITDTENQSTSSSFTYQINGIVDTTRDCLTNLNNMSDACDSWLQWDERLAQWGVIPNISLNQAGLTTATNIITSDQIIGGINLVPTDLKASANKITISFPNDDIIGQTDYRYYWLENQFKSPNEPENNLSIGMPFVNNSFQATYLGYRKLFMSREDIVINFSMDYSGIKYNAGDIVFINHEWYGWATGTFNGLTAPGKPFRITQIKESKETNGFLSVQITAMAYNDSIYYTMNPHYFTPDVFGQLTATNFISKPDRPIIPYTLIDSTSGSYVVQGNIPVSGMITGMEFWYSIKGEALIPSNNYVLYNTQYYNGGNLYPHLDNTGAPFYEQTRVYLPSGNYWWRTRAEGPNSLSEFTDASTGTTWDAPGTPPPGFNSTSSFTWTTTGTVVTGNQVLDGTISGSKVTTGDPQNTGGSNSGGFFDTLGKVGLVGLGAAAAYVGYKKGIFDNLLPDFLTSPAGGNDAPPNNDVFDPNVAMNDPNTGEPYGGDNQPNPGDEITVVADVTPDPGPISGEDNINFDGYDTAPFYASNDNTGGDFSFDDLGDLFG